MNKLFHAFIFSLLSITFSFSLQAENFVSDFGQKFIKIESGDFIMGTQDFDLLSKEVKPKRTART